MKNNNNNNNNLLIGIIIVVIVFLLFGMFGFGDGMGGCMMGNWNYGFGGMWIFGFLFMTLILVALIFFILWLVKQLQEGKK